MESDQDPGRLARERAAFLNKQAEWCVEMATKTPNVRLFERYVDLATAYRTQATELLRQFAPTLTGQGGSAMGGAD